MPSETKGYTDLEVAELWDAVVGITGRGLELSQTFLLDSWTDKLASEHAAHGFCRRVTTLGRCIHNVFELIPPEKEGLPERDVVTDTEINLQAFLFNVFGALDNLAWIVRQEKGLMKPNGKSLGFDDTGLGPKKLIRSLVSGKLATYLASFDPWFEYLEQFRHALAHQIPIYVPPISCLRRKRQNIMTLKC